MNKKAEIKNRIDLINRGEVPEGYKKVHGYIIPNDWNIVPIKKIARQVKRSVEKPSESYYRLSVRSHAKGTFHSFVENPETVAMEELFQVKENDLIVNITFAWEHAIAIVKKEDNNLLVSHRFPTYEFNSNASVKFYENIIKLPKIKKMLSDMSPGGAGRNRVLNQTDFYNSLYIPYTNFKEQEKIAKILNYCDKVIELKEKLILEIYNFKTTMINKIKVSLQNETKYRLDEIANFRRGSFPQPYGLPKWYDDINGKPFVQICDILGNKKIRKNTKNKISQIAEPHSVFVPKGSLIISIQGSIGRVAITEFDAYIDRTILFFTEFKKDINIIYLAQMIELLFAEEKNKAPGQTIKTITKEVLSSFVVKVPNITIQNKIANFISQNEQQINLINKELEQYKQLKKSLSQLLLTGVVRTVEVGYEN